MAYQMKTCSQCGAGLPVSDKQTMVSCRFCGSQFDVIRRSQHVDRQITIDWTALAVGGIIGFIIGGLVFTPFGRSLGKATVARGAEVAGIRVRR